MLRRWLPLANTRREGRGRFGLALTLTSMIGAGALAAPCTTASIPEPAPEPTRLLALYDGGRTPDPRDGNLHRFAEAPLNHLGYRLDYLDVAAPLSDAPLSEEVAGLISWFDAPVPDPGSFVDWALALRTECGRRPAHIILGAPAIPLTGSISQASKRYLALAGLTHDGPERAITPTARTTSRDPAVIGFETAFLPGPGAQPSLAAAETARSHLGLAPTGAAGEAPIDLVVTTQTGGYASKVALVGDDPRLGDRFWILNPFAFFELILGSDPRPIPDVTTANGRRLFFSTVQAEGWLSHEPARLLGETGDIAARVLLRDLIRPFPGIPVTVAVLHGDLDAATAGPRAAAGSAAARQIYSLPQVLAATNGHDLVRDWKRLHGDIGEPVLGGDAHRSGGGDDEAVLSYAFRILGDALDLDRVRAQTGAVRKYAGRPFDPEREISGALAATADLAQDPQGAPLFLWPAGAGPTVRALDLLQAAGAVGLGGGPVPSRPHVPHLSALQPVSAPDHRQVYDAFPADIAFSDFQTAPIGTFHGLTRALGWTEHPRRLAPFQLAYSALSARRFDARVAIANALTRAQGHDFHVITAADYVRLANGFQSLRADRVGPNAWKIRDRGALQTLRFDHAEGLAVDLDRSEGVLGARRKGASLYVALDPGVHEPMLRLIADDAPSGVAAGGMRPALLDSGVSLRRLQSEGCGATFLAAARAGARLRFQLSPGQHLQPATAPGALPVQVVEEGPDGIVTFEIANLPDGDRDITFTLSCEAS